MEEIRDAKTKEKRSYTDTQEAEIRRLSQDIDDLEPLIREAQAEHDAVGNAIVRSARFADEGTADWNTRHRLQKTASRTTEPREHLRDLRTGQVVPVLTRESSFADALGEFDGLESGEGLNTDSFGKLVRGIAKVNR